MAKKIGVFVAAAAVLAFLGLAGCASQHSGATGATPHSSAACHGQSCQHQAKSGMKGMDNYKGTK